jgi:hypothetical protein
LAYQPAGLTVRRVVAMHLTDGSDDEYRNRKMQGTKAVISNYANTIDEFRIVLLSGAIVQPNGDL